MKILLAAPRVRTARGIIGGHCEDTLKELGHEVIVFDLTGNQGSCVRMKKIFNRLFSRAPFANAVTEDRINGDLFDLAARVRPDMILVLFGENIEPRTLLAIRAQTGAIIVNWVFDTLLFEKRRQFINSVAAAYDHIFLIDSLEILENIPAMEGRFHSLPLGYYPGQFMRLNLSAQDRVTYGSDVAFIGTLTSQREEILKNFADLDLKIWGLWQGKRDYLRGRYCRRNVYGKEAVKIYNAARIIIDLHQLFAPGEDLYNVSPRVFEVPACGGFLLAPYSRQIPELYRVGKEMIVYHDFTELRKLILYYLDHPLERASVADNAFNRANAAHTYKNRLNQLIETVGR